MGMVLSLVRGTVAGERLHEVTDPYRAALGGDPPPAIAATYLLTGIDGSVAIATFWHDRADLDAMIATGEEPFARRLIREAGGAPTAEFFDVAAAATAAPPFGLHDRT